ncbi:L-rhamnose mutarotase [Oceaniglobus trochenteri]|uniref:L-rhamnose mutarotase n=1 Tax=Oceaniglobus trochenteri TaxID=2763260 RepID=UPI001CFFEC18|nr:L-rhamnose mutarotase [Oceaniglobus trochenteri]
MKRMGMAIGIRPEKIAEYKRLHADAWPGVLRQIRESNIRNYVIYLLEPENMLFAHLEYHGDDFDADMARMAEDPETREWWTHTDPCQTPLARAGQLGNWVQLEEVFFTE